MKPTQRIAALLFALALGLQAVAEDPARWPTPQVVRFADLVVVGTAAKEQGGMVIRVAEVLKGPDTQVLVLSTVVLDPFGDPAIKAGNRGVYFLQKEGARYRPFNFDCYKSMDHLDTVRAAIRMLADPAPFLDVNKVPENLDIIYVLTEGFTGWSIASKELPGLKWTGPAFYEVAPGKRNMLSRCDARPIRQMASRSASRRRNPRMP